MLSVSSKSGCLYTFAVRSGNSEGHGGHLSPHSILTVALKPLPLHGMAILGFAVVVLLLTFLVWHFDMGVFGILRALSGNSEVL